VLAALLAGLAAWLVLGAALPHPRPRGGAVVVAARDLAAGHTLQAADLRVALWPDDIRPSGAQTDPALVTGRTLSAGLTAGEAVTTSRVRGAGLLVGLGAGEVAAHVPLQDAQLAAILRPGDHVDVIAGADGSRLARDLVVLAVDGTDHEGSGWVGAGSPPPGGVLLAVTDAVAADLARATAPDLPGAGVTLVLRPGGS